MPRSVRSRRGSSRQRRRAAAGAPDASSGSSVVLGHRASNVRRAALPACRMARPELRRSAPAEAPVKSSVPAMKRATPTMSAPGLADHVREAAGEAAADRASLVAPERDHEAEGADDEPRAERLQVDELAADEHQPADAERARAESRRRRRRRRRRGQSAIVRADRAAVPPEPEHRREEAADRDHPEPPQLGMVVRSGLLARRFRTRRRACAASAPACGLLAGGGHWACSFCGGLPYPPRPVSSGTCPS